MFCSATMNFLRVLLLVSLAGLAASQNCGFYRTSVGSFNITVLSDGTREWDSAFLFPEVHPAALALAAGGSSSAKNLMSHFNVVHLDTGTHKVMLDTGNGLGFFGQGQGRVLENMEAAGLDPNEVDTVVISHAHPDHIGGVVKPDGSMVFPNAKYFMGRDEVEFWEGASVETDNIKSLKLPQQFKETMVRSAKIGIGAIMSDLTLVNFEEEIIPGLIVKSMVGETPGQIGFLIRSGDDSVLYASDLILTDFVSIEHPEWPSAFEMNISVAISNRFNLLERLAREQIRVFMYHQSFPGIGRIIRTSTGYGFRPAVYEF